MEKVEKEEKISEEELEIFKNKFQSIQKGINILKSKFESLFDKIQNEDYELQYGLSFFESKQDMMLIYITNLLNICYTKICGNKPISDLPIITDNLKISSLIERIKVIEIKLQHLINKTINNSTGQKSNIGISNEMDLKPRILSEKDEENEGSLNEGSEQNEGIKKGKNKKKKIYLDKSEIYKVKNENIDFYENKEDKKKRRKQLEKDKEKIKNSDMIKSLKEQISDNPRYFDNNSNSYYNKYMKDVEKYEKEHFVNITVPKKIIKQLKRKDNNMDSLAKIDTDLKILSNSFRDNKESKGSKGNSSSKNYKNFINKKRKHK